MKLERVRREYAGKIAAAASLRSRRLVDALAAVPREAFLGPGPWQIKRADETGHDYQLVVTRGGGDWAGADRP